MQKTLLLTAISGLSFTLAMPVHAAQSASLDQRVNRLERMMENPVLLQLSRRLGEQQRDIQNLQDENDRLKRDLRNLRALMDKRYKESDDRFSRLEGGSAKNNFSDDAGSSAVIDNRADVPLAAVEQDANSGVGKAAIETHNNNQGVAQTKVQQEALQNIQGAEAEASEAELEKMTTPSASATVKTKEVVIKTRPATEDEKAKYKSAFALMRASKYDESISKFEEFISLYPESELASNSAYWSGEGYLIKGQNQKALEAFLMVLERYPESPKVPDATLRAGDSYENLGNKEQAIKLYNEVIESRPQSRAAKNAQKRLEKL